MNVTGVPDTCCIVEKPGCGNIFLDTDDGVSETTTTVAPQSNIYQKGCFKALSDAAHSSLGAIIGGVVILAILQVNS